MEDELWERLLSPDYYKSRKDDDDWTPLLGEAIKTRAEAVNTLLTNFDGLDSDEDGYLNYSEIAKERRKTDSNTKLFEASYLAANYLTKISDLSNDEWFDEDNGMTKKDLAALAALDSKKNGLAAEFDAGVAAFGKLTLSDINNVEDVAKSLRQGNPLPLSLTLDRLPDWNSRLSFFQQVTEEHKGLHGSAKLPNLTLEAVTDKEGDYWLKAWIPPSGDEEKWTTLFVERYCPHDNARYDPAFRMR